MRRTAAYLTLLMLAGAARAQPAADTGSIPAAPANALLVFLPQRFYSDEQFDELSRTLARSGIPFRVCTDETLPATSLDGVLQNRDVVLRDVRPGDYAGIVLVGGSGAALDWDDSLLFSVCRGFDQTGKLVAAIDVAPIILARAGLLAHRTATVFPDRAAIGELKQSGCRYSFKRLVVDRNIITAATSEEAKPFSRAIAARLKGK